MEGVDVVPAVTDDDDDGGGAHEMVPIETLLGPIAQQPGPAEGRSYGYSSRKESGAAADTDTSRKAGGQQQQRQQQQPAVQQLHDNAQAQQLVFVSWRMSECKVEVKALQTALGAKGVKVIVVGELPGGGLLQAVTQGMQAADLFIIMGTETYGTQTSGIIDTYKEMQYIISSKKPYFLFNMNPKPSLMRFHVEATNVIFNLSTVSWERWEVHAPRYHRRPSTRSYRN
jgi:hypothetical protein